MRKAKRIDKAEHRYTLLYLVKKSWKASLKRIAFRWMDNYISKFGGEFSVEQVAQMHTSVRTRLNKKILDGGDFLVLCMINRRFDRDHR